MDDTRIPPAEPGAAPLRAGGLFRPGAAAPDLHVIALTGGREADAFCTDYPSVGPDRSEYGPRGPADCSKARPGVFLDPEDRAVRRTAEEAGIPYDWTTAARRSPVHALIGEYRGVLPLHPEYRTLPMVRYIPSALPQGCSPDHEGDPGAGGDRPFGQDPERRRLPLVPVENFHALHGRRTTDDTKET